MRRIIFIVISIITFSKPLHGQNPDWGTFLVLDKSQSIVVGKMHVEDLWDGLGTLKVIKVLKGDNKLTEVKVKFSDKHPRKQNTKQAEPPKYYYFDGQEGIWLLFSKNNNQRFDLRFGNLYYDKKWELWIKEKLIILQNREWASSQRLAGSVIVDSVGGNKLYRFFYLCFRNDSKSTLYINMHYRIQDSAQRRIQANIITPENEQIDMITGGNNNCRLAGEPGWPIPGNRDFISLKAGERMYLLGSGDLRCFYKKPSAGIYIFQASYHNYFTNKDINGKIWIGEIKFPVTKFSYSNSHAVVK